MSTALSRGRCRMRRSKDARSSPSTYSIVRKGKPAASPMSKTRQTLGCETCRANRTSRWKRACTAPSRQRFRKKLHGHRLFQTQVVGAINLAHAAPCRAAPRCDNPRPGSARERTALGGKPMSQILTMRATRCHAVRCLERWAGSPPHSLSREPSKNRGSRMAWWQFWWHISGR